MSIIITLQRCDELNSDGTEIMKIYYANVFRKVFCFNFRLKQFSWVGKEEKNIGLKTLKKYYNTKDVIEI